MCLWITFCIRKVIWLLLALTAVEDGIVYDPCNVFVDLNWMNFGFRFTYIFLIERLEI